MEHIRSSLETFQVKRQNNELLRSEQSLYDILKNKVKRAKQKLVDSSNESIHFSYAATEESP